MDEIAEKGAGRERGRALSKFGRFLHECGHPWPEDVFVQAGDRGLVLEQDEAYTTAFFEAFPADTFIRGEGRTIIDAENECWEKFQSILKCPGHELERRGRMDGYGYCKHCSFATGGLEPLTKCKICGKATNWTQDKHGAWHCEEHADLIPAEDLPPWKQQMDEMEGPMEEIDTEDIGDVITAMRDALLGRAGDDAKEWTRTDDEGGSKANGPYNPDNKNNE